MFLLRGGEGLEDHLEHGKMAHLNELPKCHLHGGGCCQRPRWGWDTGVELAPAQDGTRRESEQRPAGWLVSGQRDGAFVGAQTTGVAVAEPWWVAEETQTETGGLVGVAALRADRMFEDGEGVVSHK